LAGNWHLVLNTPHTRNRTMADIHIENIWWAVNFFIL
jgi:hypothetical protein